MNCELSFEVIILQYDKFPITNKKLGITYTPQQTTFRIWSPLREKIELLIYPDASSIRRSYQMIKYEDGVHETTIEGDLKDYFYTYLIESKWEVTDPYSIACSINSIRSSIINLRDTNPEGWDTSFIPSNNANCDAIIYEVHIKDFTVHPSSKVKHGGKYLGFIEDKMLNHLKDLGVTHIHLMPIFDFITVREDKEFFLNEDNYSWGYDPELYNVPEGSYSTDSSNPICRIKELKTLIMELHKLGFKVIMDVVYNHTYRNYNSNLNIIMPGYYYRSYEDGRFSNGSGCGNELATERPMVQKFIIDSLKYWISEYKIDGFRFDLMALIDIDTIKEAIIQLKEINPHIFIYGEPWIGGNTSLPEDLQTTKGKQKNLPFAFFNDDFRNAIKGDNDGEEKGFIQGNQDLKVQVETGITGSICYDDVHIGFTANPCESINYINSHDNLIITDKIANVFPSLDNEGIKRFSKLAFSILFTSQGIPLIHAGNEFLRSKNMIHNSYNSPLSINAIDWALKEKNMDFYNYFKDLIRLRKSYREFRLEKAEDIRNKLKFIDRPQNFGIIAYTIFIEEGKYFLIIHNANRHNLYISIISVKSHLKDKYGYSCTELKLIPIFDVDGLVDENIEMENENEYEYENEIEVPYLCTVVYEIHAPANFKSLI